MRIIHIGPFSGNSGDLFAYSAFQKMFRKYVTSECEFTNLNIREFYRNNQKYRFDLDLAQKINTYDMLIIGGGLYFDVRWNYSSTGTTLDFSEGFLDALKVPVLFNSIGYAEPEEGALVEKEQQDIFDKFERFVESLVRHKNVMVTIRNDGSYERLKKRFGKDFADLFYRIPDNGFYFDKDISPIEFEEERLTVGISVANDSFVKNSNLNLNNFNNSMVEFIQGLISTYNARIIFFPQIPKDIEVISEIVGKLTESEKRFNLVVAPYNTLDVFAARMLVSYYKACDLCVCMRLHANIIALQNRIPTLGLTVNGLVSGERIHAIYDWMDINEYSVQVHSSQIDISDILLRYVEFLKSHTYDFDSKIQKAMSRIEVESERFFCMIKEFVKVE